METTTYRLPDSVTITQQIHKEALKFGEAHLLSVLHKWLSDEAKLVHQISVLAEQFFLEVLKENTPLGKAAINQQHSQQLLELLEKRYPEVQPLSFEGFFNDYREAFSNYLLEVPVSERRLQSEERFNTLKEDPWKARFIKFGKKQGRKVKKWPTQTGNQIRRLRNKEPKPYTQWEYDVPLQNLARLYFQENLALTILPLIEEAYRVITKTSRTLWQVQSEMYQAAHGQLIQIDNEEEFSEELGNTYRDAFKKAEQELKNYRKSLPKAVIGVFAYQNTLLERDYELAGTLELPAYRFRETQLKSALDQAQGAFSKNSLGWASTLFALYDDWRLDQELNLVNDTLWLTYFEWLEQQLQGLHNSIFPQTDHMSEIIQGSLERIEDSEDDELKRVLRQERKTVDQQLINELIPLATSAIHEQGFALSLSQFREAGERVVSQIADQRGLVASDDYDQPLKPSDISYISPRQLAEHEMLPMLEKSLSEIQLQTRQKISNAQKLVQEVGQISYFSLDSAISVYGQESETLENPKQVAEEGLKRSLTNAERLHEQLQTLIKFQQTELQSTIQAFTEKLTDLKDNHYALELKFRVARALAAEQAKSVRHKTFRYARLAVPRSVRFIAKNYHKSAEHIGFYRKQIGIEAGGEVTTEISDFLAETESAVNRLPYVYQRLFSVRPLNDAVFYQERPQAMEKLQQAFENWNRSHYASTILTGQKGSGLTTLIRFFIDNLPKAERRSYEIVHADSEEQIYTESEFLEFFQQHLSPEKPFEDLEAIIDFLCQSEVRHIFILEHLEHFYLRKVGGFQRLRWLLELISRTHRQVFWLMSCTQYAWDYLNKTLQVDDHFEYIIELSTTSHEVIQEIILKRNRVSGYDLRYAPSEEDEANKKFQKLDEVDQQAYLERKYFEDLNRITQGNFAISLLYWLRSAQEVSDNCITIGSLTSLEYSFLKSLSVPQLSILHALLLHDGITAHQFQELAGRREEGKKKLPVNLQLIQLLDDGLLVKQEDIFHIHPLLYQQVVEILQTRNFVH